MFPWLTFKFKSLPDSYFLLLLFRNSFMFCNVGGNCVQNIFDGLHSCVETSHLHKMVMVLKISKFGPILIKS
jgi:hypothetical protein